MIDWNEGFGQTNLVKSTIYNVTLKCVVLIVEDFRLFIDGDNR